MEPKGVRGERKTMIVLWYYNWTGTSDELKELNEMVAKICAETDGIEAKGPYMPHNVAFNYAVLFKTENYGKFMEFIRKASKLGPKLIEKISNAITQILTEV